MGLYANGFNLRCDGTDGNGERCQAVDQIPMKTKVKAAETAVTLGWVHVLVPDPEGTDGEQKPAWLCKACNVREQLRTQGPLVHVAVEN